MTLFSLTDLYYQPAYRIYDFISNGVLQTVLTKPENANLHYMFRCTNILRFCVEYRLLSFVTKFCQDEIIFHHVVPGSMRQGNEIL
jgi:hypothetical protein